MTSNPSDDAKQSLQVGQAANTDVSQRDEMVKNMDDVETRVSALEKAQASQSAALAGSEATQSAAMAGLTSTNAAMQAGTMATMVAGGASLIIGIVLGMVIALVRR